MFDNIFDGAMFDVEGGVFRLISQSKGSFSDQRVKSLKAYIGTRVTRKVSSNIIKK